MALVDMESVQFYQPPIKAAPVPRKQHSALITTVPAFVHDSNNNSDSEPVKIFDMSLSPLEEFTDPFFPWTPESKCILDVRDYSHELNRDILARNYEEDFFTTNELLAEPGVLCNREKTPEVLQDDQSGSIKDAGQEPGHSAGLLTTEKLLKAQPVSTATPASMGPEREKFTHSIARPSSDRSTSTTFPSGTSSDTFASQPLRNTSITTSNIITVANSPSDTLPPKRNGPVPSNECYSVTNERNENTKIGTVYKGGSQGGNNNNSDSEDSNPPLLASSKQRIRSTVSEKHSVQRRRRRHRFTSPLRSDRVSSSYIPIHTTKRQKTIAGNQLSQPQLSQTAVIYEQQSWEGEIVDERDVQHGRGRPRKQYLIQWNRSWMDGNRLNEPHLLQNWRERKMAEGPR